MNQIIKKKIKSDINLVNDIVSEILSLIDEKIGEDNLFDIRLILSELIINSIKHGNKYDINKTTDICLYIDDKCVEMSVGDEGEGFTYSRNLDACTFCESGRGLLLVECLSDMFIVCKNFITSIKYI